MNRGLITDHKDQTVSDTRLAHYYNYNDYIDSLVNKNHLKFLKSRAFARAIAMLGYRMIISLAFNGDFYISIPELQVRGSLLDLKGPIPYDQPAKELQLKNYNIIILEIKSLEPSTSYIYSYSSILITRAVDYIH